MIVWLVWVHDDEYTAVERVFTDKREALKYALGRARESTADCISDPTFTVDEREVGSATQRDSIEVGDWHRRFTERWWPFR